MLRAVLLIVLLAINLVIWGTPVFFGGLLKLLTFGAMRRNVSRALLWLAGKWVDVNNGLLDLLLDTQWDIEGNEELSVDEHYLIISNHISWIDIFAVMRAFRGKTPFIRFFLKKELIWFPIVGQASWALGFPFMRRYSPEYLEKHPEKRGRDLATTRAMCRRYRRVPVAILNFLEGTRFTSAKQIEQGSPYRNLLRPRTGGVAFVLASLGDQLEGIVDVTLIYPQTNVTMWDFVTNRVPRVTIRARRLEVPPQFCDAAITEPGTARDEFRAWIEGIWREKDALIDEMRTVS